MLFDTDHCIPAASGCPAGRYLSGGACLGCPMGTFGAQPGLMSAAACSGCSRGKYGTQIALTSDSQCSGRCSEGRFGTATGLTANDGLRWPLQPRQVEQRHWPQRGRHVQRVRSRAIRRNEHNRQIDARAFVHRTVREGAHGGGQTGLPPTSNAHSAPQVGSATRQGFPPSATAAAAAAGTETSPKDSRERAVPKMRWRALRAGRRKRRADVPRNVRNRHVLERAGRNERASLLRLRRASSRSKAPLHAQTAQTTQSLPRTAGSASGKSPHSAHLVKKLSVRAPQAARTAPRGGM